MKNILLIFMFFLFSGLVYGDVTIIQIEDGEESVEYYQKNKMAVFYNNQVEQIMDLNSGKITMFNHENRTYAQEDINTFGNYAKKMSEGFQNQEAMAQFKNMMKNSKTIVKKIGSKSFSGYSCEMYQITHQGIPGMPATKTEVCVSEEVQKIINKNFDIKRIKNFSAVMNKSNSQMMGGTTEELQKVYEKGYPIYEKTSMPFGTQGSGNFNFVLKKDSIPSSKFNTPSGYKKLKFEEFFTQQMN